jgi:hypothetical protein
MDRACSTHETYEKCIQVLFGISEQWRPLWRYSCRLETSITMLLKDVMCACVN